MDYKKRLKELEEQIEECDSFLNALEVSTESDAKTYDMVLARKMKLSALVKQYQEIVNSNKKLEHDIATADAKLRHDIANDAAKLELQEKEGRKNRLNDWFKATFAVSAPLIVHHIEWRQLPKIEQWETVVTTSGKEVIKRIGNLLKFK